MFGQFELPESEVLGLLAAKVILLVAFGSIVAMGLPIGTALVHRRPDHARFWICGLDGVRRGLEATAMPLVVHDGTLLGAVAFFWEKK